MTDRVRNHPENLKRELARLDRSVTELIQLLDRRHSQAGMGESSGQNDELPSASSSTSQPTSEHPAGHFGSNRHAPFSERGYASKTLSDRTQTTSDHAHNQRPMGWIRRLLGQLALRRSS